FAVLSRLEEPKMSGLTLLKKLKLYDGEDADGFRQKDIKQIKEQTEREGMDGISPRFIINRVSASLIKPDTRCINPIDVLRAKKCPRTKNSCAPLRKKSRCPSMARTAFATKSSARWRWRTATARSSTIPRTTSSKRRSRSSSSRNGATLSS